ncbi:MAG TPA: Lrp/AsnC family transcriptional regulator [Vicinamibacteria bacterium]|nr:Lrp/AsnC family transcriptional regulator [Vicinamibacteria bacterium]
MSLDDLDRRILVALSQDGRRSAADLAKELGLSRQAVTDRIRGLEESGVIRGYRAEVDAQALGLSVRAQLRLTLDGRLPREKEAEVLRRLRESPLVRSVYRVSGEDCFVATVVARRIEDVTALLTDVQATRTLQSTRTAFVLESVVDKPGLGPIEPSLMELAVPAPTGAVSGRRVRVAARRSRGNLKES